ncbi:relaxase domain-containing protein [Streptomyces sp. QTS137]
MEEAFARLGWTWEPREVTPEKRPVMEIAGTDRRLTGWQSTRRQQIADVVSALMADYEEARGHPPGERAAYVLDHEATDGSRSPKLPGVRSLSEPRDGRRGSAIRAFGACTVYRPVEQSPGDLPWPPPSSRTAYESAPSLTARRTGCSGTPAGPGAACARDDGADAPLSVTAARSPLTARRRLPTASAEPLHTPGSSVAE